MDWIWLHNKIFCYLYVKKLLNPKPSNWTPAAQWFLTLWWVFYGCSHLNVLHKKYLIDVVLSHEPLNGCLGRRDVLNCHFLIKSIYSWFTSHTTTCGTIKKISLTQELRDDFFLKRRRFLFQNPKLSTTTVFLLFNQNHPSHCCLLAASRLIWNGKNNYDKER